MRSRSHIIKCVLCAWLSLIAAPGFAQKVIAVDTSGVTELRIDPLNSYGGTATEVFDSADYIPLETTKESTFGRIDQMEVTDEYFIILDRNTNCILLFSRDGKYHCKISGGSVNANRDNAIYTFNVNKWKKEIIHFRGSRTGSKYIFYDFNGKFLREVPFDFKKDPDLMDYKFIGADQAVSSQGYNNDTTDAVKTRYLVEFVKGLKEKYATAFPYNIADYKFGSDLYMVYRNFFYAGSDSAFFYTKPYDYNIYKLTPNTATHAYRLILPLFSSLPKGFNTDSIYDGKRRDYCQKNKDVIYMLSDCHLLGDNLVFRFYSLKSNNTQANLIYNLKSGMLISYDDILTDEKTFFLPIKEQLSIIKGFLGCDGKHVYAQFSSVEMFRAREQTRDKKPIYSPVLQQYFNKGSDRDNPVLLKIKFKDKL